MRQDFPIPDESVRATILTKFAANRGTDLSRIRVGVLNGIVHLAGSVDSLVWRGAAEELAGKTPGVRGVVNRIEAPGAPSPARVINLDLKND